MDEWEGGKTTKFESNMETEGGFNTGEPVPHMNRNVRIYVEFHK